MEDFAGALLRATKAATCEALQLYGAGAPALSVLALMEPTPVGEAVAIGAGIAALAAEYGCGWDPDGPKPPNGSPIQGCQSITDGTGTLYIRSFADPTAQGLVVASGVVGVTTHTITDPYFFIRCWVAHYADGSTTEHCYNQYAIGQTPKEVNFGYLEADSGTCNTAPYVPPPPDPFIYTDPTSGCSLQVEFQSWAFNPGDVVKPVMKISPAPTNRSSGGVIGGCNFAPVVYMPGGPIVPWHDLPDNPDGTPWWLAPLLGAIGGIAAATADKLLEALLEQNYPAGSREIHAACDYKENGSLETFSVNYPEEPFVERVLTALDAITDFQQQILLWKTPTCSGGGSSVSGEPVTINWVSDEYSSAGGNRLRKLLTYFDQVGSTLEQTVSHWKDFTWQAGPVIVSVNDVPLGKPQVWAASVDEGKRVINHAAAIAGVDMTNASWLITSPRSSRYGETGTMRIHRSKNGTLGITKRDGPSGLPPALG